MARQIVILGAGGFGREVAQLITDISRESEPWDLVGFLSEDPASIGITVNGLLVLGGLEWLRSRSGIAVAVAVGSPAARRRLWTSIRDCEVDFPILEHPSVVRGHDVTYGAGAIICAGNILTTNISIGRGVILNLSCTVGHDVVVEDFATVAPGVNISGHVTIGQGAEIGTGSAIIQGLTIGEWSVVGAGAVVARAIPANATAVGSPAKPIKERTPGWHLA